MTIFIYFIYEGFKFVLSFGRYHKNIVDKAQIAAGFAFNEKIVVSLFEHGPNNLCVFRSPYCSHGRTFDLKVKL